MSKTCKTGARLRTARLSKSQRRVAQLGALIRLAELIGAQAAACVQRKHGQDDWVTVWSESLESCHVYRADRGDPGTWRIIFALRWQDRDHPYEAVVVWPRVEFLRSESDCAGDAPEVAE